MNALTTWISDHIHVWSPLLVVVALMINRWCFKWRLPDWKQWFYLLASASTLASASSAWWTACKMKTDPTSWAMMLGVFLMIWLAGDTAWKIVSELRPPTPPLPGTGVVAPSTPKPVESSASVDKS